MADEKRPQRVAIVGAGLSGLSDARALRDSPFSLTLIDRTAQHSTCSSRCCISRARMGDAWREVSPSGRPGRLNQITAR